MENPDSNSLAISKETICNRDITHKYATDGYSSRTKPITIEEAKLTESVKSVKLWSTVTSCPVVSNELRWQGLVGLERGAMKEGGKIRRRNCGSRVTQKKKTIAGRIVEAEGIHTYLESRRSFFEWDCTLLSICR